ncbi:MAG TPA: hypothetical protein DIT64_17505 [Verrucomicrobiales bacterium]|nr:hypothetical protein [Verrucomicrobiales bacterium]
MRGLPCEGAGGLAAQVVGGLGQLDHRGADLPGSLNGFLRGIGLRLARGEVSHGFSPQVNAQHLAAGHKTARQRPGRSQQPQHALRQRRGGAGSQRPRAHESHVQRLRLLRFAGGQAEGGGQSQDEHGGGGRGVFHRAARGGAVSFAGGEGRAGRLPGGGERLALLDEELVDEALAADLHLLQRALLAVDEEGQVGVVKTSAGFQLVVKQAVGVGMEEVEAVAVGVLGLVEAQGRGEVVGARGLDVVRMRLAVAGHLGAAQQRQQLALLGAAVAQVGQGVTGDEEVDERDAGEGHHQRRGQAAQHHQGVREEEEAGDFKHHRHQDEHRPQGAQPGVIPRALGGDGGFFLLRDGHGGAGGAQIRIRHAGVHEQGARRVKGGQPGHNAGVEGQQPPQQVEGQPLQPEGQAHEGDITPGGGGVDQAGVQGLLQDAGHLARGQVQFFDPETGLEANEGVFHNVDAGGGWWMVVV